MAPTTQPTQGLGVLGIKATELEPGYLTSGNTRRAGYVLLTDLAPSIAKLAGVELDEASIEGRAVERRDGPPTGPSAAPSWSTPRRRRGSGTASWTPW